MHQSCYMCLQARPVSQDLRISSHSIQSCFLRQKCWHQINMYFQHAPGCFTAQPFLLLTLVTFSLLLSYRCYFFQGPSYPSQSGTSVPSPWTHNSRSKSFFAVTTLHPNDYFNALTVSTLRTGTSLIYCMLSNQYPADISQVINKSKKKMKVLHLIYYWFPLLILACLMAQSLQLFFAETNFPGELHHGSIFVLITSKCTSLSWTSLLNS